MAKYDLTGSLDAEFTFSINDKEFKFKKPTVREMREVSKRFSGIEREQDPDKQVELSDSAMAELYRFVEPINHDVPVADLIADQPVDVQLAFNDMVKKELGAS